MTTTKGTQSINAHLLPRFFLNPALNAAGQAHASTEDRFILSSDDLNDPEKRALFTSEAKQRLPWLHRQSELWEDEEHANEAFQASRELATSIDNWARAAIDSAVVMSTITDIAQDPAISEAMLPAMKAMAEANNDPVQSLLVSFAAQGVPAALEKTKTVILANRLGIETDRYGWTDQLGLILAVRHFQNCDPVKVVGVIEHLQDQDANPIPLKAARDLVAEFADLNGMEETVHEALREAHDYLEYLYSDDNDTADKDRLIEILTALSSTDSENLKPLSDNEFAFLNSDLTLPVIAMLRCLGYHAEVSEVYYDQLEKFAQSGKWMIFADENLQVLDGEFEPI